MPITAGGDVVADLMFNAGRAAAQAQAAAGVTDPSAIAQAVKRAEMEAFVTWFTTNATVTGACPGGAGGPLVGGVVL